MYKQITPPNLSIVIPIYNRTEVIGQGLDSIFSQGLSPEVLEVLAVNNGSTDPAVAEILSTYTYDGKRPENLRVVNVKQNRRGGSGRNAGIRAATGEYILHMDHDDVFAPGSLSQIYAQLKDNPGLDMLFYDYEQRHHPDGKLIAPMGWLHNSTDKMTGEEYLCRNNIPPYVWLTAYRRQFILDNQLFVPEGEILEDADYACRCLLLACSAKYIPIPALYYYQYGRHGNNVTNSFTNPAILGSYFRLIERMYYNAKAAYPQHPDGARVAYDLCHFRYNSILKLYLWALPYSDIVGLLKKYPPLVEPRNRLTRFASQRPKSYAILSVIVAPFYKALIWAYRRVKGIDK